MKNIAGKRVLIWGIRVFCLYVSLVLLLLVWSDPSFAQEQPVKRAGSAARSVEEERLNILKADIQKEIEDYKKLKKELEVVQKALDEKTKEKLSKLVKMYEAMPAEDAARKIEKLDEETAVLLLTSIKPKTAGKILAQIETEKAASISKKILAQGKALPEKSSP